MNVPIPHAPDHPALLRRSIEVITENQATSGAYPACPAFDVYRYSWFRDGSFIAEAASRAGAPDSADAFHRWCAQVVTDRAGRIEELLDALRRGERPDEVAYLPTRYTLDGEDTGEVGWWDFQLDGYGTWLWALAAHLARHGSDPGPYREAVRLTVDYLAATWSTPCYDWWEEYNDQVHGATLGAIRGGLHAVAEAGLADREPCVRTIDAIDTLVRARGMYEGHLAKWLGSKQVDGSLLACLTPFGNVPLDGPVAALTLRAAELDIMQPDGGVYRYLGDTFYGGGQWPVLTGFLGWHYARIGRTADARRALDWIASYATEDHLLPEQAPGVRLQAPRRLTEWEERWGHNATPLLWSHAMYLILADELGVSL